MRGKIFRRLARRDQRGVVLVMAVPGFVLAVVALALSVDVGRQVLEKRNDQKVADLAALDAVRDLPNAQAAAEASAGRNDFDLTDPERSVLAERGTIDANRVFSLDPNGDAVRVTVTSAIDYIFLPYHKSLTARVVAELDASSPPPTIATTTTTTIGCVTPPCGPVNVAGFSIGSTLASLDTTKAPLLNRVLGPMLKGAASGGGTADVVGWQGLLTSNVTLSALRDHLELLDAGVQFGTVDQMLDADVTLAKLAQATANALNASGDTDAALYAGPAGIVAQATNTTIFKLGKLLQIESGAGDAALATELNAWQLLTGSAVVANGTNLVSVPDIGIALPAGMGTTTLSLKVIEAQKTYIGPVGGSVSTNQVELTVTPVLNRTLSVIGLTGTRLTGSFPFSTAAAGATGTLTGITCPNPNGGIGVRVDLTPYSASSSGTLGVTANVLGIPTALFSVTETGTLAATDPTPEDITFAYPGEFTPTSQGKRVGTSPLGLGSATTFNTTITALGALPVPVGLAPAVVADLKAVVDVIDDQVMRPLRALGVTIGAADVMALKNALTTGCVAPTVTTPTTTATTTTTLTPTTTAAPPPKLVG